MLIYMFPLQGTSQLTTLYESKMTRGLGDMDGNLIVRGGSDRKNTAEVQKSDSENKISCGTLPSVFRLFLYAFYFHLKRVDYHVKT